MSCMRIFLIYQKTIFPPHKPSASFQVAFGAISNIESAITITQIESAQDNAHPRLAVNTNVFIMLIALFWKKHNNRGNR